MRLICQNVKHDRKLGGIQLSGSYHFSGEDHNRMLGPLRRSRSTASTETKPTIAIKPGAQEYHLPRGCATQFRESAIFQRGVPSKRPRPRLPILSKEASPRKQLSLVLSSSFHFMERFHDPPSGQAIAVPQQSHERFMAINQRVVVIQVSRM
jgi:hypothetical protein